MSIDSEDALRELYPAQSKIVRLKCLTAIDAHIARFIALSPFLVIGSSHPDSGTDVSPRGDAPGFVQVIDANTVMIPDRPGNNRLDTLSNVIANPDVGLIFFVPGVDETARLNGRARIEQDGVRPGEWGDQRRGCRCRDRGQLPRPDVVGPDAAAGRICPNESIRQVSGFPKSGDGLRRFRSVRSAS